MNETNNITFSQAVEIVTERERLSHKDDWKIFYPDPMNENDCAMCGKAKELHREGYDHKPMFCQIILKHKDQGDLMREAAELYIERFKINYEKNNSGQNNKIDYVGIFKKHYEKRSGNKLDETTLHHMEYCLHAMKEAAELIIAKTI